MGDRFVEMLLYKLRRSGTAWCMIELPRLGVECKVCQKRLEGDLDHKGLKALVTGSQLRCQAFQGVAAVIV